MKGKTNKFLTFFIHNKKRFFIVGVFVFALSLIVVNRANAACGTFEIGCHLNVGLGDMFVKIATYFLSFASYVFGILFPLFLNITGALVNSPAINTAWQLIRDVVNMFFIFFLLISSLTKLFGQEKKLKQHTVGKQILFILGSAFLINFSKVLCGIIIDITQLVTLQFINAFIDSITNISSLFDTGTQPTNPTIVIGLLFIVAALAFLAVAMTSMLYILIRAVALGIYTAMSPLWFLAFSFPFNNKQIDKLKSQTFDKFIETAIGGPILAFYLWVSLMLLNTGSGGVTDVIEYGGGGPKPSDLDKSANPDYTEVTSDIKGSIIMKMVVACAVMLFAEKKAMEQSKQAGTVMGKSFMNGVVDKVGNIGMKPLNTVRDIAKDKFNTAKDTVSGLTKLGLDRASQGTGAAAGALRAGREFSRNLREGAAARGERLQSVRTQQEALNKAYAMPEATAEQRAAKEAAILKAKNEINKRKTTQGRKVQQDVERAGGVKKYVGNGIKKYGAAAGITAAAALTAGIAPGLAGIAAGGLVAGGGAVGAKNFVTNAVNRKGKAEARLEQLKKQRENIFAHPERYGDREKEDINKQIAAQTAIIKEEDERKKLAADRSALGIKQKLSSQKMVAAAVLAKENIHNDKSYENIVNGLDSESFDINNRLLMMKRNMKDKDSDEYKALSKEEQREQDRMAEEYRVLSQKHDAIQDRIAKITKAKEVVDDGDRGINTTMDEYHKTSDMLRRVNGGSVDVDKISKDSVRKQEGTLAGAEAKSIKAGKAIGDARKKSAAPPEEKEKSDAVKAYEKAKEKIEGSKKYANDVGEYDAGKARLMDIENPLGNINELIAMIGSKKKDENGNRILSSADVSYMKRISPEALRKAMQKANDEDVFKSYKDALEGTDFAKLAEGLSVKDAGGEQRMKDHIESMFKRRVQNNQRAGRNGKSVEDLMRDLTEAMSKEDFDIVRRADDETRETLIQEVADKLAGAGDKVTANEASQSRYVENALKKLTKSHGGVFNDDNGEISQEHIDRILKMYNANKSSGSTKNTQKPEHEELRKEQDVLEELAEKYKEREQAVVDKITELKNSISQQKIEMPNLSDDALEEAKARIADYETKINEALSSFAQGSGESSEITDLRRQVVEQKAEIPNLSGADADAAKALISEYEEMIRSRTAPVVIPAATNDTQRQADMAAIDSLKREIVHSVGALGHDITSAMDKIISTRDAKGTVSISQDGIRGLAEAIRTDSPETLKTLATNIGSMSSALKDGSVDSKRGIGEIVRILEQISRQNNTTSRSIERETVVERGSTVDRVAPSVSSWNAHWSGAGEQSPDRF